MSLIKEQEIIKQWVEKYSKDTKKWNNCRDVSSYWKARTEVKGIEEYDFSTLSKIQQHLDTLWSEEKYFKEIEKTLAIGVLRASKEEKKEAVKAIPDYVYIF